MKGQGWRQSSVLAVQEQLSGFPHGEADKAITVLNCARLLHPTDALKILDCLQAKSAPVRAAIYKLAVSDDPRDRERALTDAANMPPMPDPRVSILDLALDYLNRAIRPYPKDPLTPRLTAARAEVAAIRAVIKSPAVREGGGLQ
jgi:hypothetical protein